MRTRTGLLLVALASLVGAGAARAQGGPVVTLSGTPGLDSYAYIEFEDPFVSTEFDDRDSCSDDTCTTRAQLAESYSSNGLSASGTATGSGSSSILFDPEEGVLLAVTAQGNTQGTANASFSSPAAGLTPRGGAASGAASAGAGTSFGAAFMTTVPLLLEVSPSIAASAASNAAIVVRSNGTAIVEGRLDPQQGVSEPPGGFSAVIPAGVINISVTANAHALECSPPCGSIATATASFSFTLELSPAPGEVRWTSSTGGSWDDPANWEPQRVPEESDTALFDLAANYAVTFPAGAPAVAGSGAGPLGPSETCTGTRRTRAQSIRNGTTTWSGAVSLASLSEFVDDPGFRVGGAASGDDPTVILANGELCSLFASIGDTGLGTAEVRIDGGSTWRSPGRLRVGDAGPGALEILGSRVIAGETRVGRMRGGSVRVDGAGGFAANLDAGALLVGAPELASSNAATVAVENGAQLLTSAALVGAAPGVCIGAGGTATNERCATGLDCLGLGGVCNRVQRLSLESGGAWTAFGTVAVGGGTIVDDAGAAQEVSGAGALRIDASSQAVLVEDLRLGTTFRSFATADVDGQLSAKFIRIGESGTGTLRIGAGGQVDVVDGVAISTSDQARALLSIEQGALLSTSSLLGVAIGVGGEINLDGTIEADVACFLAGTLKLTHLGFINGVVDTEQCGLAVRELPPLPSALRANAPAGPPRGPTIGGDLSLGAGTTLTIPASGPGVCPQLNVGGNASLGGTLELVFAGGYLPKQGESCSLLAASGVSGGFQRMKIGGVAPGFVYDATLANGVLDFTALSDAEACASDECEVPTRDGIGSESADFLLIGTGEAPVAGTTVRVESSEVGPGDVGLTDPTGVFALSDLVLRGEGGVRCAGVAGSCNGGATNSTFNGLPFPASGLTEAADLAPTRAELDAARASIDALSADTVLHFDDGLWDSDLQIGLAPGLRVIDVTTAGNDLSLQDAELVIDGPADAFAIFRVDSAANFSIVRSTIRLGDGGIAPGQVLFYAQKPGAEPHFDVRNSSVEGVAFWDLGENAGETSFDTVEGCTQVIAKRVSLSDARLTRCAFVPEADSAGCASIALVTLALVAKRWRG